MPLVLVASLYLNAGRFVQATDATPTQYGSSHHRNIWNCICRRYSRCIVSFILSTASDFCGIMLSVRSLYGVTCGQTCRYNMLPSNSRVLHWVVWKAVLSNMNSLTHNTARWIFCGKTLRPAPDIFVNDTLEVYWHSTHFFHDCFLVLLLHSTTYEYALWRITILVGLSSTSLFILY